MRFIASKLCDVVYCVWALFGFVARPRALVYCRGAHPQQHVFLASIFCRFLQSRRLGSTDGVSREVSQGF